MLSFLFAPVQTPKELIKQAQKDIRQGIHAMEREIERMEERESDCKEKMREHAKSGNTARLRNAAKDLVRLRSALCKMDSCKMELETLSSNLQTINSTTIMTDVMRTAARAIMRVNSVQSLPAMQAIMRSYLKEQDILAMKQEVMNSTLEEGENADGEGEEDELVNQVLDEMAVTLFDSIPPQVANSNNSVPAELAKRFDNLKK